MIPAAWLFALLCSASVQETELTVRFVGPASDDGALVWALFVDPEGYAGDVAHEAGTLEIVGGEAVWSGRLPRGNYAIKAYHDVNDNGVLDRGRLGIPKEPYGFSNDARGRFGPPRFEEARFRLGLDGDELTIRLR